MLPLFFGSSAEPLFGAYDAPRGAPRGAAVLLLNPVGWEYLRAHRAVRVLSARLADRGFDVFRFDYTGTGDSWGTEQDASLDRWLEDAVSAAEELQAIAGGVPLHLVGLRHGARLAQLLAAEGHVMASRVVLWDPPVLETLGTDRGAPPPTDDGTPPVLGIPATVTDGIIPRAHATPADPSRVLVVTSGDVPVPADLAAFERVAAPSGSEPCWIEQAHHGAGPIPQPLIELIVEWMAQ